MSLEGPKTAAALIEGAPRRHLHLGCGLVLHAALLLGFTACEDDEPKRPAVAVADAGADAKDAAISPATDTGLGGDAATADAVDGTSEADVVATDMAAPSPDTASAPALYLMGGTFFSMPKVTYVVPVRSLAAGTPVDYKKGLEFTGGAGVYAPDRAGQFFIGSAESPTLTRYDISPEGAFTKGKTLSLAAHGFSNAVVNDSGAIFLSPTRAYFIHQEDMKAVVWNPTSMEIEGPLPLPPELTKPGFVVVFDGKAQRRGNELYLVASWADHTNGKYPAGSLLITIDTTTNTIVSKEPFDRCGQIFGSTKHPNGDIYYASSSWSASTHRVLGPQFGSESCLVRLKAGERRFDPDFYVKLPDVAGGQVAGDLVAGSGNQAFIRVLDEKIFPIDASKAVRDLTRAQAWRWWRLDLDTKAGTATNLPPGAAGATEFVLDGAVYTSVSKADFSETTLIEMTAPGEPKPALVLNGYVHNGIRVH